ncbi:thiosulfate dehydrogenase [Rhodovulum imhoffii]|uniref:Thiosulfate dehydrogenase n=1 Tax=Rhodovulum imhoffii TaxID=365340 RepID=A0A2T5BNV3_9RHOB|nr:hypothetical protein [Rhodovulum imhoffii]PTN00685.1 thiosulfate dehydrogenase [Rhodovulum imhoffii]
MTVSIKLLTAGAVGMAIAFSGLSAVAQDAGDYAVTDEAELYFSGAPNNPTEPWLLAAGGRIYDNWWEALDKPEPQYFTHPSYPAEGKASGAETWRCKECHGWDYKGVSGVYRSGSHYTGIIGIEGAAGRDVAEISAMMRDSVHGYTEEMINDEEMERLAAFVSRGQIDMSQYIDLATREITGGNVDRGREVFQTICSACHGFDGRKLNWGDPGEDAFVATEAVAAPDEVLNKILNAHPGVEMVNLRAFGTELAADVLRYASTLPQE